MSDQSFNLVVEGMHCGGCVKRVKAALEKLPGIVVEEVLIGSARGTVDIGITDLDLVVEAVKRAGYAARREPELG